jgi:putative addiction module component (TIGR02574 family)
VSNAEIREAALKLSSEERARLAEELLSSLDAPDQAAIDAAWGEEAERRIDALDAGKPAIPAEDVFREIESRRRQQP